MSPTKLPIYPGVAISRDAEEERAARLDMILEEFRLNSEDLAELVKHARAQALKMREDSRLLNGTQPTVFRRTARGMNLNLVDFFDGA